MARRKKRTISKEEMQDSLKRVVILQPTGHASPAEIDVFVNFLFDILCEDFQREQNRLDNNETDALAGESNTLFERWCE